MVTPKTKSNNMNKVAEAKFIFRKIDGLLKDLEILPPAQQTKTVKTLRKINEDLCDSVVTILLNYGRAIQNRDKENADRPKEDALQDN